jgi:hypothetical protein
LLADSGHGVYIYIYIYGERLKHKNVNSKCTYRQMTRLRLTKDRTGLSSERAPTKTGQQIPDPNSQKGSNICSKVHKVGSTPSHSD